MKMALLSDIHLDKYADSWEQISEVMVKTLEDLSPDLLVVAGDIAGRKNYLVRFLESVMNLDFLKLWVPGNHDLWAKGRGTRSSWFLHQKLLPFISKKFGWHYLPGSPLRFDDRIFVGNPGWYNYTLRIKRLDNEYTLADYVRKISPQGRVLVDRLYAKFGVGDPTIAEKMLMELIVDMRQVGFPPALFKGELEHFDEPVGSLVAVSHFVPYPRFVIDYGSSERNYFNAFLGNSHIGAAYDRIPSSIRKVIVFGHTHHFYHEKNRTGEYVCSPVSALSLSTNILYEQISSAIKVLKV